MPCAIRSAMLVFCRRLSFVSLECSSSCKLPPYNHHAMFENPQTRAHDGNLGGAAPPCTPS
jgi:hypothetical protein